MIQGQEKIWHNDDYFCNNNKVIEWYDSYQKRKAQKNSIKEELLPMAWHPDRVMDWCMPEGKRGCESNR